MPEVRGITGRVVGRESPLFTYDQSPGREDWTVASAALGKGGSRWLPVRQPGAYTAEVFRTLARAQGIDLPEGEMVSGLPAGTEIARADSEALTEVLREMLKFSTNITAECCGLASSGAGNLAQSGGVRGGLAVGVVTCRQAVMRMSWSGFSRWKRSRMSLRTGISRAAHSMRRTPSC